VWRVFDRGGFEPDQGRAAVGTPLQNRFWLLPPVPASVRAVQVCSVAGRGAVGVSGAAGGDTMKHAPIPGIDVARQLT